MAKMNEHEARHAMNVLKAYVEGQDIQVRVHGSSRPWNELPRFNVNGSTLGFNFGDFDYQIAPPQPRTIYVNLYPDGEHFAYNSEDQAKKRDSDASKIGNAVKFVEVVE